MVPLVTSGSADSPTPMPRHIAEPARIPAPGDKTIEEHVGRVSTETASLSVAHMVAPPGWDEPAQRPDFDEVTIVVRGTMRVEHDGGHLDVGPGETVLCEAGERIRYLNPSDTDECEYWAVCAPAFSPGAVHREA
jgi:mannose-6-phosphate isomerase-like protein (cupin superfamily)